ncbi:hypothetical protein PLA107_029785 (plasmid) [Pseudomonas amygdali pv. lachrymans str. M301315]|uniref:Uncharacterized protein n=1 Tax=Pseudomonas amygdali pv. lachrymans str. M301315 TaxID=629260 RepID=A0AAD0M479_PSEAV|nr:hypothetical protein PLA107_029785 [Pseudomonas amygdali pv. lachrymans str. M301315]
MVEGLLVYHGSPHRPDKPAFGSKSNECIAFSPGNPFYVTATRSFAVHFARGGTLTTFRMMPSKVLDATDPQNVDKLLGVFNCDIEYSNSPWNVELWGEAEDSAYMLLESPGVWAYLVAQGVDAVKILEEVEPYIESFAIINPSVLELAHTVDLRRTNIEPDFQP